MFYGHFIYEINAVSSSFRLVFRDESCIILITTFRPSLSTHRFLTHFKVSLDNRLALLRLGIPEVNRVPIKVVEGYVESFTRPVSLLVIELFELIQLLLQLFPLY